MESKSDFPRGISVEIFFYQKSYLKMKKNLLLEIYQSPTWFFFNKLFDAKINKFKSFGFTKH